MENKNTIIALILMLIVWTGFTYFFPPEQVENKVAVENIVKETKEKVVVTTSVQEQFVNKIVNKNVEKTITIENDNFIAVFSTKGGSLVDYKLKKYKKENSPDSSLVSMLSVDDNIYSILVSGSDQLGIAGDVVFTTKSPSVVIVDDRYTLVFEVVTSSGLLVTKSFVFTSDSYTIKFSSDIHNGSAAELKGIFSLNLNTAWDDSMEGNRLEFVGPVSYVDGGLETVDVEDLDEGPVSYNENVMWTGFESKYFISTIVGADLKTINVGKINNIINNNYSSGPVSLAAGDTRSINADIFYGPKDVNILSQVNENLAKAVDFGFFKILAKPLHTVLNFFYSYIGNYGVSIIILTIILKMIFWPLTQKSYVSMKAMQTIQPEMKKLREKYSSDKESLNKKMMELYKEHRVNPLGGCLPMVVQIPVFFALYKVLLDTIELRHAPFVFWLTDLSVKDPYYITPLIMGATMFIQQRLTPSTMDPMQAKMMLAMPVVFTFLFLNFPSGLVVYWLVNNLLTIFQQYLIYKKPA
ncbi:MAG: membrane protein insertase YidC [Candidatus Marinimicrobia bacterium]|nr:membrane protein insertase YidC [Candidatus Neomarinimicrobiota bacterium]